MTIKLSVDEISSEKKLLTNESCFILLEKKQSDKRKQQLSANNYQDEAWSYAPLTTERFQMILLCDVVFQLVYNKTVNLTNYTILQ